MPIRRPPGPKGRFLLGSLGEFRRDLLGFLTSCAREYGDLCSYRLGARRIYLVSSPEWIERVLVTDNRSYHKHYAIKFLKLALGDGLLTSEDELWLRQRRMMQPAFLRGRLEGYAGTMVEKTAVMLDTWQDGERRDVHRDMTHLALSIVAKALLDVDIETDGRRVGEVVDLTMDDFRYRLEQALQFGFRMPTRRYRRVRRAIAELHEIIDGIISQRRASGADHGDLLSTMLQARDEVDGGGMSDRQLRDEMTTLFLAGHETTANALAWSCYLLATHPEAARGLRAELDRVLGSRLPTHDDLPRLGAAERVVRESMRLYPPAYAIGRTAIRDTTLGDYEIKAGQTILISQWVVHRDPRLFERPDEFLPERWLTPAAAELPKYAYFPFGGGPRVCIGNTFATMETTLILAAVASQFEFKLAPGQVVAPYPTATLRPRSGDGGVLIDIRARFSARGDNAARGDSSCPAPVQHGGRSTQRLP